ncbi:MAG: hypothetical protein ACKO4P_09915 [Betaproteobacteria bacterium]
MKQPSGWIELPPITEGIKPNRLLVFLPGESSAELFTPVALAWQLKFPSAVCIILQPPHKASLWWEKHSSRRDAAPACAKEVARQIRAQQRDLGLIASQTTVIGFAQGATIALELARSSRAAELSDEHPSATEALHKHPTAIPQAQVCSIVVAYAAQLARPLLADERVPCSVHLIHGDLDHRVSAIYGHQAYRSLKAAGADVTWDLIADTAHTIGRDAIIVGTMRAMQRIFRGRSKGRAPTLH